METSMILLTDGMQFFETPFFEATSFLELVVRFLFNSMVIFILIRYMYYPVARRKDYFFTYLLTGTIVFMVSYALLRITDLGIGVALGLFALFGILRFRTIQLPIKEMTYLFLVIGISVINAMSSRESTFAVVLFMNIVFVVIAWAGERYWMLHAENSKTIMYEKVDLVKPENHALLIKDLEKRTGLTINRVDIGEIDFIRHRVQIRIYYRKNGYTGFEDFDDIRMKGNEE